LLEEQAEVQERIEAKDGWDIDPKLEVAMEVLPLLPTGDNLIKNLSGGERQPVALCRPHPASRCTLPR
jgi:ATPase subunit of ABC transporter with duplicated ATPase domains